MNIYFIPPWYNFASTIARSLSKKYSQNHLELTDLRLILPSNRSISSIKEAFLKNTSHNSIILPRMLALGDIDSEDFGLDNNFMASQTLELQTKEQERVISRTKQRLLLTRLIEKFQYSNINNENFNKSKISTSMCTFLAAYLAEFLDETSKHELNFIKLKQLVPDNLAKHWQSILKFMDIIIEFWPQILQEQNLIDQGTYRSLCLNKLTKSWQEQPPQYQIIAAGSTGSINATFNLLKTIAGLPNGSVILPGLDRLMSQSAWQQINTTHPQFGLKQFLEKIEFTREQVQPWPLLELVDEFKMDPNNIIYQAPKRALLASKMMLPASSAAREWQDLEILDQTATKNITRIEAKNLQEEATVIATILRDTAENPDKSAALITNNYDLATLVSAILKRWEINIDSSLGHSLGSTKEMTYLCLIAQMVSSTASTIDILSCLKNPLAAFGKKPGTAKKTIAKIEVTALSGKRVTNGLLGIKQQLIEDILIEDRAELAAFIQNTYDLVADFYQLMQLNSVNLKKLLLAHINAAENLATTDKINGKQALWQSDTGEELKQFILELEEAADDFGDIDPNQYLGILEGLLQGLIYRPKYGFNQNLAILSPIESRMQNFDTVILGDLNEGSWPKTIDTSPWMSKNMLSNFGLPLPEVRIGQSAHDFINLFHNENIILSRAKKIGGTITIASRWLMRLDTILGKNGKQDLLPLNNVWLNYARLLSKPEASFINITAPEPKPPLNARIFKLSATAIQKLVTNPYGHYAEKILRLKKIEPVDNPASNREFGAILHKVIEEFITNYNELKPEQYLNFIHERWKKLLASYNIPINTQVFWETRFAKIADEFIRLEQQKRQQLLEIHTEISGSFEFQLATGQKCEITAIADRIEIDQDGNATIIDYKTKSSINNVKTKVLNGALPQLPIEALILQNNGFITANAKIHDLQYWFLKSSSSDDKYIKIQSIIETIAKDRGDGTIDLLLKSTLDGIYALLTYFYDVNNGYKSCPNPDLEPDFNDYEHLARKQ